MASYEPTSTKTLVAIYALVLLIVVLWGTSIALFGIPGLYIPAVCAVPVIGIILLMISRG
ncbi:MULTISPECIES: hypothetical protein [unclassified Shimia]|uniref:hypothetical protein n=1 Tax=unclassified Shimia TaxID=2630038 RepID=UPI0006B49D7A|nr:MULTISPECIES: hypothetical protein [unclassified Shimia]KPA20089.1 hypothetical protein shim_35870 [Shimia sp. SK013]